MQRQHVVVIEQAAVEPRNAGSSEAAVALPHGAEQVRQHRREQVRLLHRFVENVGEHPLGKQFNVLGEQAEDELVEEVSYPFPIVRLPDQLLGDASEGCGRSRRHLLPRQLRT